MKQLLLLLALFVAINVNGQGGWLKPNNSYGTIMNGLAADGKFTFPTTNEIPSTLGFFDRGQAALRFDSLRHCLWVYDPKLKTWDSLHLGISGGGGVSATSYVDTDHFQADSLSPTSSHLGLSSTFQDTITALWIRGAGWKINGNSGTAAEIDFMGTTDDIDVVFKRNDIEKMRLQEGGVSIKKILNLSDGNSNALISGGNSTMTGSVNVGVGENTLAANTTGSANTSLGAGSMTHNTTGSNNTAVGQSSLYLNVTGNTNTAIGDNAGTGITTGSNNIAIGSGASVPDGTADNQLSIANLIYGVSGSIGIGAIPDVSAVFDVSSTTKGMLIPRMTEIQRDGIVSPTAGLLIYNTTTNAFNYYNAGWNEIGVSIGNTIYTGNGILPSDRTINLVNHSLIFSGNSSQFPLLIKDTSGSYENTLFRIEGTINSPSIFLKGTFTDDVDTLSNSDIFAAYNGGMRGFYINPSAPLNTMLSYFEEDKDGLTLRCYTDIFHGMQQCFTSQKNNFGVSFFDDSVNTYAANITPGAINFSTNNMGDHVQHTAFEYQPTYNFNVQFPLLQADASYQNNTLLSLSKYGDFQINGTHVDGSGNGAINPNLIIDALGSTTFSSLNSDGITSSERVKINSHNDIVDIVFSNSNVGIGTHPVVKVDILGETQIVGQSTTTNTLNVQNANSGTGYTQVWGRSGFGNFAWIDANGNFEANSLKQDVFNSSMVTTDGSGKLIAATAGADYSLPGVLTYNHTIFTPTTGGTITIINKQYNIVNPAGALLALTVNLPASPNDNDVVIIKFTKAVTTVTYSGGTISDSLISPVAGGVSILTYDSGTSTWY